MKAAIFDYNRTLFDPEQGSLFPCVIDVLELIKKRIKLAVMAKGGTARLKQIEEFGLPRYFDVMIINQKKDLNGFKTCFEELGVMPEETYVIGDRILKEIKFGNELGAVTIWFRNGKFKDELPKNKKEAPNYTITNFKDLLKVIKC